MRRCRIAPRALGAIGPLLTLAVLVAAGPSAASSPDTIRGAAARRAPVPILMYHVISRAPPGAPNPHLWVAPRLFARQMYALARAGYQAVTLRQVLRAWTRGAPLPARPIVLSFDDGDRSQALHAAPLLKRLGRVGVLDLELHDVGPGAIPSRSVKRLVAEGWELASHTMTHPDLTRVSARRLRWELAASRAAIRRRFGATPQVFCYPFGVFDRRVAGAVRDAGYRAALSTRPGIARPAGDRYALPRVRVNAGESPRALLAALGS